MILVVLPVPHVFIGSKFALAIGLHSLYKSDRIEYDKHQNRKSYNFNKIAIEDMTESINNT